MDALSPPATNADTPVPELKVNAERQTTYSTKYGRMMVFCALDGWMDPHIHHLDAGLRTTTAGHTIVSTYIISAGRYSAAFKGQSPYLPACYVTLKAVEECQFISSVSSSAIDDR